MMKRTNNFEFFFSLKEFNHRLYPIYCHRKLMTKVKIYFTNFGKFFTTSITILSRVSGYRLSKLNSKIWFGLVWTSCSFQAPQQSSLQNITTISVFTEPLLISHVVEMWKFSQKYLRSKDAWSLLDQMFQFLLSKNSYLRGGQVNLYFL